MSEVVGLAVAGLTLAHAFFFLFSAAGPGFTRSSRLLLFGQLC
jgi:hypothetical protein